MDATKKIVIIIAVILVLAGIGAVLTLTEKSTNDKEINLISGVNLEGSGMYIKSDVDINTMLTINKDGTVTYYPSGWGGKIFGTPGATSIQHILLKSVVEDELGLAFLPYIKDASLNPSTVYYIASISNAALAIADNVIDGGMSWQPQLYKTISDPSHKYKELILTNDMFPGHLCSVIAGNHSYTSSHESETIRLLAAFVKATEWTSDALANPGSDDYNRLMKIGLQVAGPSFTIEDMEESFKTVTYTFGDRSNDPLGNIKTDIGNYTDQLYSMNDVLRVPMKTLGFSSTDAFVDKFVKDYYMKKALTTSEDDFKAGKSANISISVISGDIHQIAIHVAKDLGYFDDYNLDVSFSFAVNGGGVAVSMMNGEANFGILGSPPIIINTINNELVKN
jgi:ABC-type nitrate/sulfonate/bicarbonate transport system substrate-binding protein